MQLTYVFFFLLLTMQFIYWKTQYLFSCWHFCGNLWLSFVSILCNRSIFLNYSIFISIKMHLLGTKLKMRNTQIQSGSEADVDFFG